MTTTTELVVETGRDERLLIRIWTAPTGRQLVTVAPQHVGRDGEWRLKHSGLALAPDVARALAPCLERMAATIEVEPPADPEVTT
jgi:hypothetical protein